MPSRMVGIIVFLAIVGLFSGGVIATGFFAFITAIGIIPGYAAKTHTAAHIKKYQTMVTCGGIIGVIWWIFGREIGQTTWSGVVLGLFGLIYGVFTGSLIMGLAETVKAIPIFFRKMNISKGVAQITVAFAVGKCLGIIIYYFMR